MIAELHCLAALIYLNRVVPAQTTASQSRHLTALIHLALSLLTHLRICENPWPLFIIACEAVDDSSRLSVLEVFARTQREQRRRSNHIAWIQRMVEAVWNQKDLDAEAEQDISYITKMDAVISAATFMPAFS